MPSMILCATYNIAILYFVDEIPIDNNTKMETIQLIPLFDDSNIDMEKAIDTSECMSMGYAFGM